MATNPSTIDFLLEQLAELPTVTAKKMFGEYALYNEGRVVALVCDDELFIKPTDAGKKYLGKVEEAPPYPGAKPYFLISGEKWDDPEWLVQIFRVTTEQVELPKRKIKRTRKGTGT